jgi:hypothetical protein
VYNAAWRFADVVALLPVLPLIVNVSLRTRKNMDMATSRELKALYEQGRFKRFKGRRWHDYLH